MSSSSSTTGLPTSRSAMRAWPGGSIGSRRVNRIEAREILEKSKALGGDGHPGHLYVDEMSSAARTLVISLNEYLEPAWLTEGRASIFTRRDPD